MSPRIRVQPQNIQESVIQFIEERYSVRNVKIDKPINSYNIDWRPSCYWEITGCYIACEISEDKPYRPILQFAFSQIVTNGLPIRIMSVFPTPFEETKEYKAEMNKVKSMGIGLISVDTDNEFRPELIYHGIVIPRLISKVAFNKYHRILKTPIHDAYELYMNNDPKNGIQNLGQLIEDAMIQLGIQAKIRGTLTKGGFDPTKSKHYPQANLIDDLMRERVIDNGILGKCRGYCDIRNDVSHKPKNRRDAIRIEEHLREWFANGLLILEELPAEFKRKGYRFR